MKETTRQIWWIRSRLLRLQKGYNEPKRSLAARTTFSRALVNRIELVNGSQHSKARCVAYSKACTTNSNDIAHDGSTASYKNSKIMLLYSFCARTDHTILIKDSILLWTLIWIEIEAFPRREALQTSQHLFEKQYGTSSLRDPVSLPTVPRTQLCVFEKMITKLKHCSA